MFIEEIITYLRNETDYHYYFNATLKIENCIVYSYAPISDDGIKAQWKLELHFIGLGINENTLIEINTMNQIIDDLLITKGDKKLTDKILQIAKNGGGLMVDSNTQTTHQISYYTIIRKD